MAEAAEKPRRWTVDEFLEWCFQQEGRYELVDGYIVEMMAGAKKRHGIIATNVARWLGNRLGGSSRMPFQSDMAVRTGESQIRFPDVVVDCDLSNQDATYVAQPVVVVEVLSERTRTLDATAKLGEYKGVDSIRHILLIEATHRAVQVHTRDDDGWSVMQ